jgi:hypothetical protein
MPKTRKANPPLPTPDMRKLPELCYSAHISTGETVVLKRGEKGYHDTGYGVQGEEAINRLNERLGVSRPQRAAMEFGSILGFNVPGADPDYYGADGKRK